jgi:tRNA A-37 threonylcarbamoyl transferase component Bud32
LNQPPYSATSGHFIWANLAYLVRGRLRTKNGFHPPTDHPIPPDLLCVGVATSPDPAMDDTVIGYLNELGVRQVRVDFTYGDADNHVARLLDRLAADGFNIMLHLVQPISAARNMLLPDAQDEWREFVSSTLGRFGDRIESVEIGSTVNRKSWAGYTLDGFLAMWGIAHAAVREKGIRLAGPNVTDFEPTYNIGILSILKSRGQLPDIHTNNLFVERCTEPERDDHKILGRRFAALGGFRLLKKSYLLRDIGANFGVPDFVSPSAFWTLPRIERFLDASEEKQADYIARYLILCAASGALRRVGWGPLICEREGLIADGAPAYPKLERITHYASIEGNSLRVRPAFQALKTLAAWMAGAHYESCLDETDGVEVHALTTREKRIHAAWVINGRAVALDDLYSAEDLRRAECLSRDGALLPEPPDFITESPIYLCWAKDAPPAKVRSDVGPIPDLAIHAHGDRRHFRYQQNGWRGVILAENPAEAELLGQALNPETFVVPPKSGTLRKARNAVWTIPDPRDPSRKLVVKQPVRMSFHKRLTDRFKPSKALRSWNGTSELLRRGIDAAPPVAYFEKVGDRSLMRNMYLCEFVEGDISVRDVFSAFARGERVHQGIAEEEMYEGLSEYLFRMHTRGVYFRDLSGGNILVRRNPDGKLGFMLIDTGRAHFYLRKTELSRCIADLTRTCHKLHAAGRDRFMTLYLARRGMSFEAKHHLPFRVYDAKCALKRCLKGKFLRSLFKK